ncbi:MAG: ubiquitin-specific protease otu1 [Peltula sp. TS41687]|nr:MAG: ubiquitin-specific protease otu1 [Peltula sp. TS41687]
MRLRLRGPTGSSTIHLTESDTVADLLRLITEKTSLQNFEIRRGYPPEPLALHTQDQTKPLSELDIRLDGEQLIISPKEDDRPTDSGQERVTPDERSKLPPRKLPLLPLSRAPNKAVETDPPEIPVPDHGATLVLRIMPDDNSCLFRAFGTAFMRSLDSMTELRSLIAQNIQSQPETYSAAVLDQSPDEYCQWIQTEYSWGGFIELNILATHFGIEICSIDVQTLRIDRFNEGRPSRCILVYSGIHYDTIALSPSDPPHRHAYAPPDFDTTVFESDDQSILDRAVELCKVLQGKHYYTDTAGFNIRCNVCGGQFVGEKGATQHAKDTGHYDFGEAG